MRKNPKRILVFLLMIVMITSLFLACKKKEEEGPEVIVPTQSELFVDMLQDVVGAFGADFNKNLKVDLSLDASYKNGDENYIYGVEIKGNINKLDAENNDLYIRIVDKSKTEHKSMLGLYYYKDDLYMEVGNKVYGINSFDMKNIAPLLKVSGITIDDELSENAILAAAIDLLVGENGITKDEAGNYKINIDITKLAASLESLKEIIDEVLTNGGEPILNIPGIGPITTANLIKWLKENPTSINLDVSPKENAVDLKMQIKHNDMVIAADGSNLAIANGNFSESEMPIITEFAENNINDDTIFVNLGNVNVEGTIDLLGKNNSSYMTMNWKLVSDIDPFEFFDAAKWAQDTNNPYGWIEAAILNDNKFHFQVAHKCNGVCDAEGGICTTKSPKATNILDIAFDPTTFGNDYIYVNINLGSIFSSDQFSSLLSTLGIDLGFFAGTVKGMLTENQIFPINVKTLLEPYQTGMPETGEPGTPPTDPEPAPEIDIKNILGIVNDVIEFLTNDGITLDKETGLTLNITDLLALVEDVAGLEELVNNAGINYATIKDIIISMFSGTSENTEIHKFNIKVTKFVFGVNALADYSCKDEVLIYKPLTEHNEERVYPKGGGALIGESVVLRDTISDINNVKLLEPGKPIAPEELKHWIGAYIKYDFKTAQETTIENKTTSVVGFKNVKWDLYDQEQEITVVLGLLDSAGIIASIQALGGTLYNLAGVAIAIPLPTFEAKLKITFTELEKIEFDIKEKLNEFNPILTGSTKVELGAFAKLTYKDGSTKVMKIAEPSSTNFFKEKKYYYMTSEGTFYHEYEYAGSQVREENIKYLKPDNIVANFGTKEAPYVVKLGNDTFFGGRPTFHSNEIVFEYDKVGLPVGYQVVPEQYFYDGMIIKDIDGKEVKDAIKEGKFDKLGKFQFTFNFRGVEMSGWFEVKDTADSKVLLTQNYAKLETKILSFGDNNVDLTIGYKYEGIGVEEGDITLQVGTVDLKDYTSTLNSQSTTNLSASIKTTYNNSLLPRGEYFIKITAYDKATNKDLATLYFSNKKNTDGAGDIVAGTKTFTTDQNLAGAVKLKVLENGALVDKLLEFDTKGYFFTVGDKRVDAEMYVTTTSNGVFNYDAEGKFEPLTSGYLCVRITTPGYEKYVKISGYKVTQA